MDRKTWYILTSMLVGLSAALLYGANVSFPWAWRISVSAVFGAGVGYLVYDQLSNRSSRRQRQLQALTVAGFVTGLVIGTFHKFTADASWMSIVWYGLVFAFGTWFLTIQSRKKKAKPTTEKSQVRIHQNRIYVDDTFRDKVLQVLIHDPDRPEKSEKEVFFLSRWHWPYVITHATLPATFTALFFWGATKFAAYDSVAEALFGTVYGWGVIIAAGAGIWRWKRSGGLRRLIRPTTLPTWLVAVGVWIALKAPGLEWVLESVRKGSPAPWLLFSFVCLLWTLNILTGFWFGYILLTDKRLVIGKSAPAFLASKLSPLFLDKVTGFSYFEKLPWKWIRTGTARAEGIGVADQEFMELAPLRYYRELADAGNMALARRGA